MSQIEGSVGHNGDNLEHDVRVVQQLLNRKDLAPLRTINEDGRIGPATIEAIRHFQTRYLGMNSPDGRVDPDGRTFRELGNPGIGPDSAYRGPWQEIVGVVPNVPAMVDWEAPRGVW